MDIALNGYNLIYRKIITIQKDQLSQESCIAFGMWSKYNPLNTLSIKEEIGQFESDCTQLINIVDQATKSLNFIYYDCLNYSSQQIVKTIMFISEQDQSFQFNKYIDPFEYENIWYHFQLIQWPLLNKLELIIIQQDKTILKEIIENVSLFNEQQQQLLFTFGGNFQVMESKLDLIEQGTIFSLFPGQIVSYDILIDVIPTSYDFEDFIIEEYQSLAECFCQNNEQVKIQDSNLIFLDDKIYVSENINCDYYAFSGWIKVKDIIQKSDEFSYQFMKMNANIGNQQLINENLSTFQLFYHISPIETKIVIKTYSYDFPIVKKDILDSSFDIEREFIIQRNIIKSWHYLLLELSDNKFNIYITFYDEQGIQSYEAQINVKQFNNCQFKLRYGNIMQDSQNYLNVELKQLYYTNCKEDNRIQKCHYSCLDCDGPNISNCLSCSIESQRIYVPQYQLCICPLSSVDYDNKCVNNEDQNLQITDQQNIYIKCNIGYFELDGECIRCPSTIKDNLITCFECFENQKWSQNSICYTNYYTPLSLKISSIFISSTNIYNYDGSDFVICDFCQYSESNHDLQNQEFIYEIFLVKSKRFLSFCFTNDQNEIGGELCYICNVRQCILCRIAIDQQLCVICKEGYKQINGQCIYKKNEFSHESCKLPYYASFTKECKLCSINNCIYCFEYLENTYITSLDYLNISINEFTIDLIRIGCVQCQDGFIFDFTIKQCIKQPQKIQHCLTSYVIQFKEQCIISTLENFQVSRIIINKCDNYILNCLICAKDYINTIFCIKCIDEFMLQDGQCYMNEEIGSNYEIQIWNKQIKAFLLIYQKQQVSNNIQDQQCGLSCLKCNTIDKQYICDECNIDYFDSRIRIQQGFYCRECPQLCSVCRTRSFADIKNINPLFQINQENAIFTQECILPKFDPFIFYDPYLKITQYCFDGNCQNGLQLEYWQNNCFLDRFPRNLTSFYINTEYCNQIGLQTLTFSINFEIDSEFCYYFRPLITSATLKEEVFTLKTANLEITSVNQFSFVAINKMEFYEYNTVSMINTEFIFQEYLQNNFIFSNQYNLIDVKLINFTIKDSGIVNITSLFYAEQFGSINIQNFSIINTTIRNSSLFNLQLLRFEGQMTITSLFIFNCTFIDSQLFLFSKSLQKIQIENLTLDQCILQNASLFTLFINYMQESTFKIKNLIIQRNNFSNSNFLFCSQLIKIDLIDLILNSNNFDNSIIFGFSYSLYANNIQIKDNLFIQSSFLQTIQVTNDKYTQCVISELLLYKNVLQNSNIFNIFQNSYSNNLLLYISKVQIEQNIGSIITNHLSQIFHINSQKLDFKDFVIRNNQEILLFYLYDNDDIKLTNIFFENQIVYQKVFLSKNCFQKSNLQNQLLLIIGFDKIQIENCNFINQSSIDESLIEIVSSKSKTFFGSIFIKNVKFYGNLLQQLNQIQSFSLLTIISDSQIEVIIENLKYQNNFMHVYSESSLKQSAILLYISSAPSNIFINNLDCIQNSMTNSSNSFIMIRSKILKFSNIQIKNHNILPYNVWKNYYPIKINNENDQEEINLFIMQIYHIKSIGGVAYIEASSFSCLNSTFQEILASASSIFDIDTLNEGIIMISNFSVNSTRFSMEEIEGSGCLTLKSQNSLLNLQIQSVQFSNVINRISTSIFSILPSLIKNNIIIQDVQILNCISLKNQIIHIQFINQIVAQNSISLINIKIIQNQQEWETYFQIIGLLTSSEILEITSDQNSLIYLENCDIYIKDFIIEGLLITPILNLINVQNLNIINLIIDNIKSVKTQNLIQISQTIQTKSITYIKQLNIRKGYLFKIDPYLSVQPTKFQTEYYIFGCSIMNNSFEIEQPKDYFSKNIIQLQQSNYQHNAIIQIMSKSNLSNIILEMIEIENNIYQTSLYGIMYFDIALFYQLRISKLNCNYNFINEYGCLHFIGNNSVESKILIKDSNFINNNGTKGVAIKVTDISINIKNCKIQSNIASTQGGGLYIQITSNLFRIEKTQIVYNKAQEGGGIYFDKDHNLNPNNFNKSLLLFNQAIIYGNNLVESPTHLTLFINSKEMPDEKLIKYNTSTSILKIKPYKIIEQGRQVFTKQLILPSNQEINIFQLFITKGFFYQSYIKNMSLYFQNSKGELLYKQFNSTCNVSNVIIKNNGLEVRGQKQNNTLLYQTINNNFELGTLAFNLDPYESEYDYLKIQVQCRTQYSQKVFNYIMNSRSLKCQLGEFYIDNGCQICIWNQGFYSVTYNSIKCSIYDKIKFQNITSNMINLYEGYWRPNYLSDYTESCYKSPEYCKGGWGVGDNTCSLGRKGALCEMCDIYNERGDGKFFKNQQDLTCLSCSQNDNIILPFLFALFQALLSITLSLKSIRRSNQLFTSLRIFEKFSKIIFKLNQDHEGILVKMLLNYLWIFSVIFTFNISFSFSFIFIEQSSNSFYFMVNNLDCYLSNLQTEVIYIKIIFILILMLLQFNLILALSFIYHSITKNKMDNSLLSNTLLCLYVFNYGGLIKMFCSSLSSRQISNINYIQGDVSVLYDTKNHQQWIYFIIIPLLLVFGCIIPFSLFLLTYIKRDILNKIKLRKHICYLFNEYTDTNYYWEQIKLLQKAIIILITTYFENNILLKTSLLGLCLLIYQTISVKNKPYIISKFNNLDLQSGQICSITIFLAATKYESQNLNNNSISTFLQIVLLILMIRLCYPFIYNIFTVYYKKYSYFILSKIYQLSKKLKINSQFNQSFGDYLVKENDRQIKLKMNFLKLKEYLLPKSRNQNKIFKFTYKNSHHLKSNTNSGTYFLKVTNE